MIWQCYGFAFVSRTDALTDAEVELKSLGSGVEGVDTAPRLSAWDLAPTHGREDACLLS